MYINSPWYVLWSSLRAEAARQHHTTCSWREESSSSLQITHDHDPAQPRVTTMEGTQIYRKPSVPFWRTFVAVRLRTLAATLILSYTSLLPFGYTQVIEFKRLWLRLYLLIFV